MSICPDATAYRVKALPGQPTARPTGNKVHAPPRKIAAQTCRWVRLAAPAQVSGETQ